MSKKKLYYFINLVAHLTGSVNYEDLSLEIEETKALSSTCISPFELPFHLGETARLQCFNCFFCSILQPTEHWLMYKQ